MPYLTGTMLGIHLRQKVTDTRLGHHPQYGKSKMSELRKGDFVFVIDETKLAPPKSESEPEIKSDRYGCVEIKEEYPRIFPYCLINCLESGDFPYLVHFYIENNCNERISFEVSYKLLKSEPGVIIDKTMLKETLQKGERYSGNVNPIITFAKSDIEYPYPLGMQWTMHTVEDDTRLDSGRIIIEVMPKSHYCWNLFTPEGEPVSHSFLLASLAAWSLSRDGEIKKLSKKLMSNVLKEKDRSLRAYQWFKQCYMQFYGQSGIEISRILDIFPPQECRDTSSPMEILKQKYGDPLEASLLVGTLSERAHVYKRLGLRAILFILPDMTDNEISQAFLLSWSADGKKWQAVNMSHANTTTFEENVRQTTPKLVRVLEEQQAILEGLDKEGVFIGKDKLTYALEFARAAKKFGIKALPQ